MTDRHTACRVSPSRHSMLAVAPSLPMDGSSRSPQRKDDARASWVREETSPARPGCAAGVRRARGAAGGFGERFGADPGQRCRPRPRASQRAVDRHRRPTLGHARRDAGGAAGAGEPRRHVLAFVRLEPAVLSEPGEHPHGQLLTHHGRLPADHAVRCVPLVPRRLDARHVDARRGLPHGPVRQVHRRLPERCVERVRPAWVGSMGRLRALGLLLVRAHGGRRARVPRRGSVDRLLDHGAGRRRGTVHPVGAAGPAALR